MKKVSISLIIIFGGIACLPISCSKDFLGRTDKAPALSPANIDIDAGTWKPVLLSAPDEFAVAVPGGTNTPDYIARVNEIKTWQKNLTNEQKKSMEYWSAGAVFRWNEILRELVSKYNLPPYQNPDD